MKTRWIKTVKIDYTDICEDRAEKKINDVVAIITANGGKVISFSQIILAAGFSAVYLVFSIIYEAENEIVEAFVHRSVPQTGETHSKWVKIVKVSYSDVDKNKVERKINKAVEEISQNGGNISSFMHEVFGVGLSAVWLVYTIIYSNDKAI